MVYKIKFVNPHFKNIFDKLRKKNKPIYDRLVKKIKALAINPRSLGHELHDPFRGLWDTHVDMYVLIYHIDEKHLIVRLVYFDHHDQVFRKATVALPYLMEDLLRI